MSAHLSPQPLCFWKKNYLKWFLGKKNTNSQRMDKKVKKGFFYPYAVNLIDMKMGQPPPPVDSWSPQLVKISLHDIKNWTNDRFFSILAMSQRLADISWTCPKKKICVQLSGKIRIGKFWIKQESSILL